VTTASSLPTRILDTILSRELFKPGDTLIIGLSGGADSTALLDLLANLHSFPLQLVAAHLNHCLRGTESDGDEEFCRHLAEHYAIPFETRRVDAKALAKENSCNLEDAGRRARIGFFDELSLRWKAQAVVLAHHADDQAETFLMRLLRGSGMSGLSCMAHSNNRGYLRPLLGISRAEIEQYLAERGLSWREDSSNQDQSFLRNRIRHELLPLLEQYNPAIRNCLTTTADLLSAESNLLDEQAREITDTICRSSSGGPILSLATFTILPLAMQRRIVRRIIGRACGNLDHFGSSHIDAVCRLATSTRPNARLNLPLGVVVSRAYENLIFNSSPPLEQADFVLNIDAPGVYQLSTGETLTIEKCQVPDRFDNEGANTVYMDHDKAPFPWLIRTPRPGDRLQPLGMEGSKKLKNLFIDCKIPAAQRKATPLLFSGNELLWVCGIRPSQTSRVATYTSHAIKVVFSHPQ
jgi:tRNA(Ile)-lysidine synthase